MIFRGMKGRKAVGLPHSVRPLSNPARTVPAITITPEDGRPRGFGDGLLEGWR